MKKTLAIFFILSVALFKYNNSAAVTYRTVASGTYSNPATWAGGNKPPATITGADTIIISAGDKIDFDVDIKFTNSAAYLDIRGWANVWPQGWKNIETAPGMHFSITGRGLFNSLVLGNGGHAYISGDVVTFNSIYAQDFTFTGTSAFSTSDLYLRGKLSSSGAQLYINKSLHMLGGTLTWVDTLRGKYSYVRYAEDGYMHIAGRELQTPNLKYLTVDLPGNESIAISNDLYLTGVLTLTHGYLDLNGHNLSLDREGIIATAGVGAISCSAPSKINISSYNGPGGTLWFKYGSSLSELIFTPVNPSIMLIGTGLLVTDSVTLYNGKLEMRDSTLSLAPGAVVFGVTDKSYIITTRTGGVSAHVGANGSFTYPIGSAYYYTPVKVTSKNGMAYSNVKASVQQGVKTMATYGRDLSLDQPSVNTTWLLEHNGPVDADVEVSWNKGMEMGRFKRDIAYLSNFKVHYWNKIAGTPAVAGSHANMYTQTGRFDTMGHFAIFDDNAVSVNNIMSDVVGEVYPNPASHVLHVKCSLPVQAVVINLSGQAMINTAIDADNAAIDIKALPTGMYYLQLKGERMNGMVKFVKQ